MNEQQIMLSDMAEALFAELGHKASIEKDWPRIEELGLQTLLVEEALGGFGGTWQDALIVFRLAGYHALGLPLVEAILASSIGGGEVPQGRGTIAARSSGTFSDGRFSGRIEGAIAGNGAAYVVAPWADGGSIVVHPGTGGLTEAKSLSGEERSILDLTDASAAISDIDIVALAAFARSAQIAGALDAALAVSTGYVSQRKQFGRTLAAFQAVQQNLATFACEAAAANCAASAAAEALDRGEGRFETAAAKLRCNMAVGTGAAIAHQVHGAIGFTEEYGLHPLTRRLWTWRSEFGNDSHWATVLGTAVCNRGTEYFWSDLTALTD